MLKIFFDKDKGFQKTLVCDNKNSVSVIYGKSQMSGKYVGMLYEKVKYANAEKNYPKYLLPERPVKIFTGKN